VPEEVDEVTVEDADADTDQPDAPDWDLTPVAKFLTARSKTAAEAAWVDALPAISEGFPPNVWGCTEDINTYGPGAHANLYNTEIRRDFKTWLSSHGVSLDDYTAAVGPVQHVSAQIYLNSLFKRAVSNKGWRVNILGFPSVSIVACGLSSHYQGTQNQNHMGEASARIRARALEVLNGETRAALGEWPSATSEDWEERGLMPEPVSHIGDLDISSFDEGRGAKLRMIRNTTVKKELATFFAIKGMTVETFISEGPVLLDTLRRIALDLGKTAQR
jgi:hypothetical protein